MTSMRMAVAVMFPGLLFQHPMTPVQKAMKTTKNPTMNKATVDLAMCNLQKRSRINTFQVFVNEASYLVKSLIPGHGIFGEIFGYVIFIRNEIVHVTAMRFHRRYVNVL